MVLPPGVVLAAFFYWSSAMAGLAGYVLGAPDRPSVRSGQHRARYDKGSLIITSQVHVDR
jgi:hypothetical protein